MRHTTSTASAGSVFDSLKIADLAEIQIGILREPSNTRPALRVIEKDGIRAIVKDFSTTGLVFRNVAGRFLVWRENKAYRILNGLRGIPALFTTIDGLALVLEEIPGRNLEKLEKSMILPESFFHQLKRLVYSVHKRGLAHCDLKRAPNTLVGKNGSPYIIDWGACIFKREFGPLPLNSIYRRFLLDDYNAIVKLKLRHQPDKVTRKEFELFSRRSRPEKVIRAVRDRLRKVIKKIA